MIKLLRSSSKNIIPTDYYIFPDTLTFPKYLKNVLIDNINEYLIILKCDRIIGTYIN